VAGTSTDLLLIATALHAGFQLTVTLHVYPALLRVPADRWRETHARHSRGILPLVVLVYAAVLAACTAATLTAPGAGVWVADAGTAVAVLVTALLAPPLHRRLASGPDASVLRRLRSVDKLRCAGALVAVLGAVAASR
jgi:hypothetical protein